MCVCFASRKLVQLEKEYPKEVEELSGEDGAWHHGFNSGCLATVRLLRSYVDIHRETEFFQKLVEEDPFVDEDDYVPPDEASVIAQAEEEFPFLDT